MPQQQWSKTDERRYEHIKQGEMERGRPEDRAEEIAARTVNKRRQVEGRTESRASSGTGNPHTPLEERTKAELMNRARELNITGRSHMRKRELVEAIRERE